MAASFTLEKRTNRFGENPIRISWAFGDFRYQTTLGFCIKPENWDKIKKEVKLGTHNLNGVTAEEINHYIKRIKSVVSGIERYYRARKGFFMDCWMKEAIKDAKSSNYHSPSDIIEKWTSNAASNDDIRMRYYKSVYGEYYRFISNAYDIYTNAEYNILQELNGKNRRLIIPVRDFGKVKDHSMWPMAKYNEVAEDEALGRISK